MFKNEKKGEIAMEEIRSKDVENILQCTAIERKRWTDEGKIVVEKTVRVRTPYCSCVDAFVYDKEKIESITPEQIAAWRKEHEDKKKETRRLAAKKAKITKEILKRIREDNKEFFNYLKNAYNKEFAVTMQLAYWVYEISLCAYDNRDLYKEKNLALNLLLKNSREFLDFGLYKSNETVISSIHICSDHMNMFKEEWNAFGNGGPYTKTDLYNFYVENDLDKCPYCHAHKDKDYYSLVNLIFGNEYEEIILNIPYPMASQYLSSGDVVLAKLSNESYFGEAVCLSQDGFTSTTSDRKNKLNIVAEFNKAVKAYKKVYKLN